MPDYNPNSIWGSKEKKYVYTPPGDPTSYTQLPGKTPGQPPANIPPSGGGAHSEGEPNPPSFFHRHNLIFFTLGIFLLIALAVVVYYLLLPPATPNVVIAFSEPAAIVVGQPFPLVVTVSNESKSILQNANLNVSLPAGLSFVGEDPSQRTLTESVGTLSSQTINPPQTIQVIADQSVAGTAQTVGAQLTYQTAATAATRFENDTSASLTVGTQSALSLSYNAPSGIFSGQNFAIAVSYQNNTTGTLDGVQLQMQYPPAYHFVGSSLTQPSDPADSVWNLGTIAANATGTLVITGNIVGPAQAQYQLTGVIGAAFSGQNYPAADAPVSFAVTPSPLSLAIAINNSSTYVAKTADSLHYVLTYTNNATVAFQSVNISATLTGSMYDLSSLKTTGVFNSQTNTVTWYAANTPALASLAPGQSGTVDFTVNTKSAFPITQINSKNYSLTINARAVSPTVPPNTAGTSTVSVASLISKVGGQLTLDSVGFYKEASTTISNTGPYPPKVNQPTQYTIHWSIANYSTDAENVTVSAYLQSGSTFTGVATSTGLASTSVPVYNAGTGELTWTIPYIPATTGVISPPVQTVFQITNTPAINQVGQSVTLLGPATLTGTDAYTSSTVQATAPAITSQLLSDPYASGQTGDVTQ